ncbi:mucin-17-like isoform X2 [Stegostoma tigrinum]|uniref:mucin-17-like isoform X2 n=1 Tax=Stegostoma tigrinum TaxID=3053191 RepID=UPI00286FCFA6|nr:mucin-17-like isoform X2 [Stegostoma tigrinum]
MGLLFLLLLLLCTHPFRVRTLGSPRGRPSHGSVRYFDYPEEITCAPSGVVVRIRNDSFQGMFIRLSIVDNYGIPRDLHSLPSSCPYTTLPQEDGSLLFSTPYKGCYVHLMNNTVSLELRIDGIDESKRIMVIERIPLSCILPSLPSVTTMGPTNGTLLTTKEPVNTTAMTTPLTKEPMDITVTKEPVDTTAVTTPLTKEPMDITVTKKPVDTTAMTLPTKEPVDTTAVTLPTKEPVDTTAMTLPTKEPVDTTAVTTPLTKEPVDTTAVTLPTKEPVDTTAMTLPTKEPVDTTAVTTPLTKEPVDTTAVTLPTKEPVDTTAVPLPTKEPVDATAVTTPLTKEPMDITVTKEPVDTTAVPLPTKEPVDTTAVTTPLTKEPVDTTAVTTPLTKEPMDITVTKEPVDTTAVPLPTKEPVDTTAVTTPLTKEPMDITVTKEPVDTTAVPLPTKEPVDTTAVPLPTKEPVDTTAVPLPTKEPVDTTAVTTPLTKEPMGITVTKEPVDTTAVTLPTKEPVDTSVTALVTKEPVNTTVLLSTKELGSAATTIPPVGQTTGFTATSVGTDLKPNGEKSYSTWFADEDYPLVKFLREPVYVEVRLLHRTDPNIELVLNDCWATQTLDPHQAPRWSILLHGCPYYKDNYLSQLHAVDAASNLSFPTHHKRFEVKTFAFWNQEIQTALSGEVYFHCSVTVCPLPDMQECTTTCGADRRMARHSDFNTSDKAAYHGLVTLKRPIVFALAEGKTADLSQANAKTTDGVLLAAAITSLVLALICGLVVCWNCKQMPMS